MAKQIQMSMEAVNNEKLEWSITPKPSGKWKATGAVRTHAVNICARASLSRSLSLISNNDTYGLIKSFVYAAKLRVCLS